MPNGSFDASQITAVGDYFYLAFNHQGALVSLPQTFKLPQTLTSYGEAYCDSIFSCWFLTKGNETVKLFFAADANVAFSKTDILPETPTSGSVVYVNGNTAVDQDWSRLFGETRYNTMKAIVEKGWSSSQYVIVASGENFPDALAASSIAGLNNAPIVLTASTNLSESAKETILGLDAEKIIIVGGPAIVSEDTEKSLRALSGVTEVKRLYGADRIATSLEIYKAGEGSWSSTAIIACASSWPDALSISPFAAEENAPIFLANASTGLDQSSLDTINAAGFTNIVIVGGNAVVPKVVENQLGSSGATVIRLAGEHRYETSAKIAQYSLDNSGGGLGISQIMCTTGSNYPDALAGGAFGGHTGNVLLLVDETLQGRHGIESMIRTHPSDIGIGYVLGGTAVVSDQLFNVLETASKK